MKKFILLTSQHANLPHPWQRSYIVSAMLGFTCCATSTFSFAVTTACDVAIVGGGPGGTHTAYKLITLNLTQGNVCLFEKKDHLGGRLGDNSTRGLTSAPATPFSTNSALANDGQGALQPFTMDASAVGQTGTGGYRMNYDHYSRFLGQELAQIAANNGAPGKLAFLYSRSFDRLLEVNNRNFNTAQFPQKNYFTYDNFGIANAFKPLYQSPVNNNDMWKIQLCGPQVPLDSNSYPRYDWMDGKRLWNGKATWDISNMNTLQYLEKVASEIIAPNNPAVAQQVAQYFLDTWRFRADYSSTGNPVSYPNFSYDPGKQADGNDAASYLNFNATDYTGGSIVYPIPSFQPYFEIMADQITKNPKGKIFLNEAVKLINTNGSSPSNGYIISTEKGTYTANKVVIATDGASFTKMDGDVIRALTTNTATLRGRPSITTSNGDMYNSVNPSVALTVTQQYGDGRTPNSGWWNKKNSTTGLQSILYTGSNLLGPQETASSNPVLRSTNNNFIPGVPFDAVNGCAGALLDTDYSCLQSGKKYILAYKGVPVSFSNNTNELPLTDYHDYINISRSVYSDSPVGFSDWKNLYIAGGDAAVTAQVFQSLRFMYPNVFTGSAFNAASKTDPVPRLVTNPDGTKSYSQVTLHDPAWYNLKKGALAKNITNESLFNWSQEPLSAAILSTTQGESVYLVGDTWRNDRSAWSDAAYNSSMHVLNKHWTAGINPRDPKTIKCINGEIVDPS